MSRRNLAVMAALALVSAPIAFAAEPDGACTREEAMPRILRVRPELTAMFAQHPDGSPVTGSTVPAPMEGFELLIARIGTDGKPVMACVDDEAAARRFLDAPITAVETKQAKEQ